MADPRSTAVANLLAVLDGQSLDGVLADNAAVLDERDRALAAELSYGVCRWYRRLQTIIGRRLQRPLKARDLDLQVLLLVGAYQLLYSRVPAHAAISTAVDLTRRLDKPWAGKLVNAVLRGLQREQAQLAAEVDRDEALRFALPEWLHRGIRSAWPDEAVAIMQAGQGRPPMTLRLAPAAGARDAYIGRLATQGLSASAHPTVASAVVLERPVAVGDLPGFAAGAVSVQDAGAQLAAPYLDLHPGQQVLDACAAPGGKTLHLLQHCADIRVTALDIDPTRLARVADNLQRGGCSAELQLGDAAQPSGTAWGARRYQRILVDAPCSAIGVLRRHPDIRLLRREQDIAALVRRQREILDACWSLLEPGGRLLYVTCSLLPVENAAQVDDFCARHADASVVELPAAPGKRSGKGVQLLPGVDDTDGFYYAALCKVPAT